MNSACPFPPNGNMRGVVNGVEAMRKYLVALSIFVALGLVTGSFRHQDKSPMTAQERANVRFSMMAERSKAVTEMGCDYVCQDRLATLMGGSR